PLEFSFALPMDRASVAAALTITPTTSVDLVWSDDDRTVTVAPDPAWLPGAEYEITLSGAARTADSQQSVTEELAYAFSTAVGEVRFGAGPNVQLINSAGDRAFQLIARGADVADLRLYAITETQFLDLYSAGFWVETAEAGEQRLLDTQGLTPTTQWREALTFLGEGLDEGWRQAAANIPAEVAPGFYVLAGEPPSDARAQLLVVLTEHALVLKRALAGVGEQSQAQVVVWDTEIDGGTPVVSATVRLLDGSGASLAEGVTGADGLLALEVPGQPGPMMALAEKDGDVTVCGLGNEWLAPESWLWRGMGVLQPSQSPYLITSYTDRPIYRPGHDVYFKALIRADDDAAYTLPPPDLPISVRLRDGRDNIVATQVLTPTQYGTVHGAFELADETMLGTWHVETELGGLSVQQAFQVEEYRKPEYSVQVRTPQKAYVQGETIDVTVDAGYYFGQPVAGADVELQAYAVHADDLFDGGMPYSSEPAVVAEGQTDADGRWAASVPADQLDALQGGEERATLALEATVTDETGRSVSSYQLVTVQQAEVGLALLLEKNGYEPDEEIAFTVAARDRDGEPISGLELVARALAGGQEEVASAAGTTDADGRAGFSMQFAEQGWYALSVSGTDEAGHAFEADGEVWVYDPEGLAPLHEGAWGEEAALSIMADRPTYDVGDAAQLLIQAPVSGRAILSFERGEIHHTMPVTLTAGTNAISVPVRADYAPNIHVSVSQFGPSGDPLWAQENRPEPQLQTASTEIVVPMDDRRLTVAVSADRSVYGAGDEATFHVEVADAEGQPQQAEVSLSIVDEAIYALAEDTSADLFESFDGKRPNLVWTFDSMSPLRWLFEEGFGGMGGDGNGPGEAPRRDFLDTALWAPALTTDENGEAEIIVELPDNLTEWRVLARAITTDTLVGEAS
ncbi:MAG: MG2 domain-containing protein, partial [Anaerolineae bacterium]